MGGGSEVGRSGCQGEEERPNKERVSLPRLPKGSLSYDDYRGRGRGMSKKMIAPIDRLHKGDTCEGEGSKT